jgi:hypothetical protein
VKQRSVCCLLQAVFSFVYFSTPKMEAIYSFEMSVGS